MPTIAPCPPPRRGPGRSSRRATARAVRALVVGAAVVAAAGPGLEQPSAALVWPDVAERVQRDLGSTDAATRRAAAREIADLGPGRGGSLAIAALGDTDPEVRLAAADAAIRLRAAEATPIVTGWLNAPDARLRREACAVASALPHPGAIAPLARTLGDPDPEVRTAAADALGHQASADAVAPLLGRMDDATPAVRIAIVQALARLGDARAVVPLVGKIEDSSADVRQQVARALGDLHDVRASAALVLALRDPSAEARRQALIALGRLRSSDAVDAIAPFVAERTPSLRLAALTALGRIATPDARRVLAGVLGTGDDATPSLGETPVRAALVMTGPAAVPAMVAILEAPPSPLAASSAAWVLGALRARTSAPAIVSALRRGSLPVPAALHALAGAGTSAEVPVVLEFLADASPTIRAQAIEAASALLDPARPDGRAVEPLVAALRDARAAPDEQARIARCLGRTGAPRAAAVVATLVRAGETSVRLAAIDALGALGAGDGDDVLLDALASPDPRVRVHAAQALAEAGGTRARDRLLAALDHDAEADRASTLFALGGILARAPSDGAVARLSDALDLASGPERDAILDALGRAATKSAMATVARAARSDDPLDRRQAAVVAAGAGRGPESGDAVAIEDRLLADVDHGVRAQAAWALGRIGANEAVGRLLAVARAADTDAAVDASAALAQINAHAADPRAGGGRLCPLLDDPRPLVRANALAGLSLARARCGDGEHERRALASDPSDAVRASAALALSSAPVPGDVGALDRCEHSDVSGEVAARCRVRAPADVAGSTRAALVYVVPDRADGPRPGAPYVLRFADGLLRVGAADRRGAVFEAGAPEGPVMLLAGR